MTLLEIENLSYVYKNNQEALDNVNLKIDKGTINVLLGLNGCGKTTLLKLITGLLKVKKSKILIDGENINDLSSKQKAKFISFVPQLSSSEEDFLVEDFLLFGFVSDLKFYQEPKEEQVNKMKEAVKKFEIEPLLTKKLDELSGGERQKVYICSAYLQNAQLIVLDEPMSALDLKNQSLIISILKELKEEGKTIILSTHNPNIALVLDSYVVLMNNGKIHKSGYCTDMIKVEVLKDIYGEKLISSKDTDYEEVTISR